MARVRATAVRWESDDFPGFIEASVRDAGGEDHRIIDKVAVLTTLDITPGSTLPLELWIEADIELVEAKGVQVTFKHGVRTVNGLGKLVVSADDVTTD
ncbi:hypothetical protein [Promicromonospora sp. NPDC019610]|uniref:hypothetical protein n=1 Tax=Promicromonospora sp. NPDC019610 TaxID=3364405 RepID=UPI0037B42D4C